MQHVSIHQEKEFDNLKEAINTKESMIEKNKNEIENLESEYQKKQIELNQYLENILNKVK